MDSENFKYMHLRLGLSRQEFLRRVKAGHIDLHLVRSQLDQYAREIKLDVHTERWLDLKSLDQVDKFKTTG